MNRLWRVATTLGVFVASSSLLSGQEKSAVTEMSGRQLFVAACANCHGADGRGAAQSQVGFTVALPDFTDCNYSSRENAQDWGAIVHEGGRVRAFSTRMPAFGSALSGDQIERVVAYVRSLCADASWPRGELNLPRAHLTEKAFPEDESVFTSVASRKAGDRVSSFTYIHEKRFGARTQIEVKVPLSLGHLAGDSASNNFAGHLGDVSLALKRVLSHKQSLTSARILSGGLEVALPTGSSSLGTGAGTAVAEPFLLAAQMLGRDAFVQFQGALEFPFDRRRAANEAIWRGVVGRTFAPSGYGRSFTPMAEVEGVRELVTGAAVEWSWVPQMQISLSRRQHISASVGARLPFGRRDGRPRELLAYLLWDWFDGGFLEGW